MPCSNRCIPLTGIAKCALAAGLCGAPCHRHLTFVIHTSSCGVCGGCCAASCCNCHGKPAAASAAAFVAATVFVAATAFTAPRCCPRGDLGGSGGFRWWAETLEVAVSDEGLLGRLLLPLLVLPPEEGADEAEAGVPEVEEDAGRSSGTPLAPPPSRLHGAEACTQTRAPTCEESQFCARGLAGRAHLHAALSAMLSEDSQLGCKTREPKLHSATSIYRATSWMNVCNHMQF